MPYQSTKEIPDYVPADYRKQWLEIFNSTFSKAKSDGKSDKDAESRAFSTANGVIEREKSSDILADVAPNAQKVTAQEAGYMELPGAVKDGDCNIVEVSDGISRQLGCCNLYDPVEQADAFRCGECTHLAVTSKKTLDTDDNVRYTKISTGHTMESPQVTLEDLISPEKIKESQRKAVLQALREELKLDEKADFKKEEVLAKDSEQDYATVSGEKVKRSDFAYAPAGSEPHEWKLPIHDESHVRNALARFNQTDLPAEAKAEAKSKILERAHKYGIDTSGFEKKHEKASEQLSDEQTRRMMWLLSDLTPISLNGKKVVEIPICIAGTWIKGNHKFSITSDDIDSMIRNFETRANGQTVIDYEHASEMPELAKGGPVPAAGWMLGLRKRKIHDPRTKELVDALTALAEWTPQAEEMLATSQYRFFSPAIDWSKKDKKTGKAIGATLTSGALTNHPFLEELPPITLSDHIILSEKGEEKATDVEDVHVPTAMNDKDKKTEKEADKMSKKAKKKLKLEKIASGDKAGKYGVFDADSNVLMHVFSSKLSDAIETMNDFEKSEILADFDPDNDGDNDASKKGDTDKDFAGKNLAGKKEKASDVEAVADKTDKALEVTAVETKKTEAQLLSDCIRIPKTEAGTEEYGKAGFDMDQVAKLTEEGALNVRAMLTASKVANEVEKLIEDGKILPKQKASMFRIALNDPEGFADFVAQAKPVLDLGVKGIQGGEKELQRKLGDSSDATQVFMAKVNELKAKNQCSYEQALRDASHQYVKEYGDYIQQTLRLSEEPNPELTPTVMLTSRS